MMLSEEDIEEFHFNELKNGYIGRDEFKRNNKCLCSATRLTHLCLRPNADVSLCNDFDYSLGNFNKISLKEIWEERMPKALAEITSNNLKDCFKYDYCKYCMYCPKVPMYDSEFMKKSECICVDARAYYKALQRFQELKKG